MFGLLNLLNNELVNEIGELHERENMQLFRRHIRDSSNPFELPNTQFKKLFRLDKQLARDLCNMLANALRNPIRNSRVPNHIKVLIAVHFYAYGSYQTAVGQDFNFGVSQPVVCRAIAEVSQAICEHLLPQKVVFPVAEDNVQQIKQGFHDRFNIPNVLGCIDGTHIGIICPPVEEALYPGGVYYNRKGFYSINVQIVCDVSLRITSINARFPGSTHDAAIWQMSAIQQNLRNRYFNQGEHFLLLQPWLLTPIMDAAPNTPESRYNEAHCSARNSIERAIGVPKTRFRCLLKHRILHYSPPNIERNIEPEGNIHNFHNINEIGENVNENDVLGEGMRVRQQLINNHFL